MRPACALAGLLLLLPLGARSAGADDLPAPTTLDGRAGLDALEVWWRRHDAPNDPLWR